MATRFYFPTDQPLPLAVAPSSAWDIISERLEGLAVTARIGTGPLSQTASAPTGVFGSNALVLFFASQPLAAQTITGTVKGQFSISQIDADVNGYAQLIIRACSSSGTIRGTLLAHHAEALSSEFWTAPGQRNRKVPLAALSPATLSALAVADGDRLLFEIGFKAAGTLVDDCDFWFGDNQAIDLPEDETTSQANRNPWIELSGDIVFQPPPAAAEPAVSRGVGVHSLGPGR